MLNCPSRAVCGRRRGRLETRDVSHRLNDCLRSILRRGYRSSQYEPLCGEVELRWKPKLGNCLHVLGQQRHPSHSTIVSVLSRGSKTQFPVFSTANFHTSQSGCRDWDSGWKEDSPPGSRQQTPQYHESTKDYRAIESLINDFIPQEVQEEGERRASGEGRDHKEMKGELDALDTASSRRAKGDRAYVSNQGRNLDIDAKERLLYEFVVWKASRELPPEQLIQEYCMAGREILVEELMRLLQEEGIAVSAEGYKHVLRMYMNKRNVGKMEQVVQEMLQKGCSPGFSTFLTIARLYRTLDLKARMTPFWKEIAKHLKSPEELRHRGHISEYAVGKTNFKGNDDRTTSVGIGKKEMEEIKLLSALFHPSDAKEEDINSLKDTMRSRGVEPPLDLDKELLSRCLLDQVDRFGTSEAFLREQRKQRVVKQLRVLRARRYESRPRRNKVKNLSNANVEKKDGAGSPKPFFVYVDSPSSDEATPSVNSFTSSDPSLNEKLLPPSDSTQPLALSSADTHADSVAVHCCDQLLLTLLSSKSIRSVGKAQILWEAMQRAGLEPSMRTCMLMMKIARAERDPSLGWIIYRHVKERKDVLTFEKGLTKKNTKGEDKITTWVLRPPRSFFLTLMECYLNRGLVAEAGHRMGLMVRDGFLTSKNLRQTLQSLIDVEKRKRWLHLQTDRDATSFRKGSTQPFLEKEDPAGSAARVPSSANHTNVTAVAHNTESLYGSFYGNESKQHGLSNETQFNVTASNVGQRMREAPEGAWQNRRNWVSYDQVEASLESQRVEEAESGSFADLLFGDTRKKYRKQAEKGEADSPEDWKDCLGLDYDGTDPVIVRSIMNHYHKRKRFDLMQQCFESYFERASKGGDSTGDGGGGGGYIDNERASKKEVDADSTCEKHGRAASREEILATRNSCLFHYLLYALSKEGQEGKVESLVLQMRRFNVPCTAKTLDCLLLAYSNCKNAEKAEKLIAMMEKVECGEWDPTVDGRMDSWLFSSNAEEMNTLHENRSIENLEGDDADPAANLANSTRSSCAGLSTFSSLSTSSYSPTLPILPPDLRVSVSLREYQYLIHIYASLKNLRQTIAVVERMEKRGLRPDSGVYNMLLNLYAQAGKLDEMELLVADMKKKGVKVNTPVYNTVLSAHSRRKNRNRANDIFTEMCRTGNMPDDFTFHRLVLAGQRGKSGWAKDPEEYVKKETWRPRWRFNE